MPVPRFSTLVARCVCDYAAATATIFLNSLACRDMPSPERLGPSVAFCRAASSSPRRNRKSRKLFFQE